MTGPASDGPVVDLRRCPFCGANATASTCAGCGRDVTAARRVCKRCGKMTPANERTCAHCGAAQTSDLGWKIPLIIAMFVAAFILAIILRSA